MNNATEQRTVVEVNRKEIKGTQKYIKKYFSNVKASTLSLDDEFLQHEPANERQKRFKEALISAIKSGLSDFRAQRMDPCFDKEGNICFKAGMRPAVGELSVIDWKRVAKEFLPEKGSRLGTTKERIAFLGLCIKYLIEKKGYSVSDAWEAVCNQSKDLGHYWDSKDAKHHFEPTGSRKVGKWYDLGNTCKITVNDETGGFSLVGGSYYAYGYEYPLAKVDRFYYLFGAYIDCVGWIVLSK